MKKSEGSEISSGTSILKDLMNFIIRYSDKKWREGYPDLEEYWQRYPETKTRNGTKCYFCGASRIESYAWKGLKNRRVHYCQQCRKPLYRTVDQRR